MAEEVLPPENGETDQELFVRLLLETRRPGMERVIANLEQLGFFEAPASTRFHLCVPGGLVRHSLNVYREAWALRNVHLAYQDWLSPEGKLAAAVPPEASIVIAALLHDVCKAEIYQKETKHRKVNGKWEDYEGYTADYSAFPMGHGEKSVIRLLQWGLELTEDEMLAIRWHMHAWDLTASAEAHSNLDAASHKCPLLALIIAADGLASRLLE